MDSTGLLIALLVLILVMVGILGYVYLSAPSAASGSGATPPAPPPLPPGAAGAGTGSPNGKGSPDTNGNNTYGTWANPVDPTNAAKYLSEILTLGLTNVTWGLGSYLTQGTTQNMAKGNACELVSPPNPAYPNEVVVVNNAASVDNTVSAVQASNAAASAIVTNTGSFVENVNAWNAWLATQSAAVKAAGAAWFAPVNYAIYHQPSGAANTTAQYNAAVAAAAGVDFVAEFMATSDYIAASIAPTPQTPAQIALQSTVDQIVGLPAADTAPKRVL